MDETVRNKDGISYSNGTTIFFKCQTGYRVVRDATLTCVDGVWSWAVKGKLTKIVPLCYRDCGPPPKVSNASVIALATVETWVARYVCEPRFTLFGSSSVVCNSSGKWNPNGQQESFPICINTHSGCGDPPSLVNGELFFDDPRTNNTITYYCSVSFALFAPSGAISNCMADNTWSLKPGSEDFPICRRGCVQSPPEPIFPLEIISRPIRNYFGYTFGVFATYHCSKGILVGNSNLTCNDGLWIPELPTCVQYCRAPPLVSNANIRPMSISEAQIYEYVCEPGYFTNNSTTMTCLENGSWSLSRLPTCNKPTSRCGNPQTLHNGVFSGEAPFDQGTSITYRCNDDFEMVAPNGPVSICQAGNKWSLELHSPSSVPECRPVCKSKPPVADESVLILNQPVSSKNGFFSWGSTIIYGCERGSESPFFDARVRTCIGYGWYPDTGPFRCLKGETYALIPDRYTFYGPRTKLGESGKAIPPERNFSATNITNRAFNETSFVPITSVCGYPGFCVGTPFEIYQNCSNQTLFECEACGVDKAVIFLCFVLLFGLAICFSNALVIWIGLKRLKRRKATKVDICKTSLAIADILTGDNIVYNHLRIKL
ncbi:unnamed protein product [Clavelina lepadiformis]|uniref:Sushi domain-containing protein n=1 Tax=Clavelina lepadiformis TaxID=159417 RepID=A0ABP0G960_CLALP